ncbi:FliO/MopB family protein [Candidatus Neomarinimicrobiota bacterium]
MDNRPKVDLRRLLLIVTFGFIAVLGFKMILEGPNTASRQQLTEQTQSPNDATGLNLKPIEHDLSTSLWKAVIYTVLILGAIVLGAKAIQKIWGGQLAKSASSEIIVTSRRYLNPKQSLAIVKVRDRELLIGITDQSIQLLTDVTDDDDDDYSDLPSEIGSEI